MAGKTEIAPKLPGWQCTDIQISRSKQKFVCTNVRAFATLQREAILETSSILTTKT